MGEQHFRDADLDDILASIERISAKVDRLIDVQPAISYDLERAALVTGIPEEDLIRLVNTSELDRLPATGAVVVFSHGELMRRFGGTE